MIDNRLSFDPRTHARTILETVGFERADSTIAENVMRHTDGTRRYWLAVHAALWRIRDLARRPAVEE